MSGFYSIAYRIETRNGQLTPRTLARMVIPIAPWNMGKNPIKRDKANPKRSLVN